VVSGSDLVEPAVLVSPDSFKGTFAAAEVAELIAQGLESAGRAAQRCPLADGGEGTVAALTTGVASERRGVAVSDPLGRPVEAGYVLIDDGQTAIVETAEAIGLVLLSEDERNPEVASSAGAGELIAAAAASGAREVLVCLGGSATVDAGIGLMSALNDAGGVGSAKLTVICDVRATWEQAAPLFGPQKGADADAVARLSKELDGVADTLRKDPRGIMYTGAAGGVSGALWSEYGASLVPGAPFVLDRIGFDKRMRASRAVIVGEGRMDSTTLLGKAPGEAATRARQAGVPCAAVCGVNELEPIEARIIDLQVVIEAGQPDTLREAGERLASLI
jgi:glycerate kinase